MPCAVSARCDLGALGIHDGKAAGAGHHLKELYTMGSGSGANIIVLREKHKREHCLQCGGEAIYSVDITEDNKIVGAKHFCGKHGPYSVDAYDYLKPRPVKDGFVCCPNCAETFKVETAPKVADKKD